MWKKITEILAAVAGAIASFFTTMPPLVYVLIGVMSIDFLTGLMCGVLGKSKKTENGYLASHEAFRGLMKKMLIILVVVLAACLDYAVSLGAGITFEAVMGATCLWFIASEGLSILENVASMGVPVPAILLNLLEIMRKKGGRPAGSEETGKGSGPDRRIKIYRADNTCFVYIKHEPIAEAVGSFFMQSDKDNKKDAGFFPHLFFSVFRLRFGKS